MKRNLVLIVMLAVLTAAGCANTAGTASTGSLQISEEWVRAAAINSDASMPMGGKVTSATYLTIQNGGAADKLVKAESDVAESVELHTVSEVNGMMQMRPVEGGIDVPANGTMQLKPGGYHIMMIGLKRDLKVGEMIDLKLTFEKAGVQVVHAVVRAH